LEEAESVRPLSSRSMSRRPNIDITSARMMASSEDLVSKKAVVVKLTRGGNQKCEEIEAEAQSDDLKASVRNRHCGGMPATLRKAHG